MHLCDLSFDVLLAMASGIPILSLSSPTTSTDLMWGDRELFSKFRDIRCNDSGDQRWDWLMGTGWFAHGSIMGPCQAAMKSAERVKTIGTQKLLQEYSINLDLFRQFESRGMTYKEVSCRELCWWINREGTISQSFSQTKALVLLCGGTITSCDANDLLIDNGSKEKVLTLVPDGFVREGNHVFASSHLVQHKWLVDSVRAWCVAPLDVYSVSD